MPTLLRDSYFVLERYTVPAFVRLARTAQPLGTHAEAVRSLEACREALRAFDCAELGILLDWRVAPSESVEQAIVRDVEAFAAPFARRAILLLALAAPGRTWSDADVQLFDDEEEAIAYVCAR